MAKVYYGLNYGDSIQDIVVQTSTTGKDMEVVIDEVNVPNRAAAFSLIESLEYAIDTNEYPAA